VAPYVSNEYISKIVDYDPKRLVGFASVVPNPADFAIKKLRYAVMELGLKGLKLHSRMQGFCLRSTHVWQVLRFAGELRIPVIIHTMLGISQHCTSKAVYLEGIVLRTTLCYLS